MLGSQFAMRLMVLSSFGVVPPPDIPALVLKADLPGAVALDRYLGYCV